MRKVFLFASALMLSLSNLPKVTGNSSTLVGLDK